MNAKNQLTRSEPTAFMRRAFSDFERFFHEWPLPFLQGRREFELPWMPELEVFERDNKVIVRLDVPGLKKDEITVDVTDEGLTIEGERKREVEEKKTDWYRSERAYGKFVRTIPLPEGIKPSEVNATFKDGVLEIVIPRPASVVEKPAYNVEIHGDETKTETKGETKAA